MSTIIFLNVLKKMKILLCTRCLYDNTTDAVASLTAKQPECCSYDNVGVHESLFSFSVIFCTPKKVETLIFILSKHCIKQL